MGEAGAVGAWCLVTVDVTRMFSPRKVEGAFCDF